jgi:hypothetical protein
VTRNIWGGDTSLLNVHVWDITRPPEESATLVASLPLPVLAEPGTMRVCAQVFGLTVRWLGWHAESGEPAWGDPATSGQATDVLPDIWSGHAGWFAGHIQPWQSASMADLFEQVT